MNYFSINQSLLNSWLWAVKSSKFEADFIKTLNREPIETNQAMQNGKDFEDAINKAIMGIFPPPDHKYINSIRKAYSIVKDSEMQIKLNADIKLNKMTFDLSGILDYYKDNVIYDTKFTSNYRQNKFIDSPQHSIYFRLVPEAIRFEYLIGDGERLFIETYYPDRTPTIESYIEKFLEYLKEKDLLKIYYEKWAIQKVMFDRFWRAYPKKRKKADAEKAWEQLNPHIGLVAIMLNKIDEFKQSKEWQKEDGQFVPYPATWLRSKGWESELEVEKPKETKYSNAPTAEEMKHLESVLNKIKGGG